MTALGVFLSTSGCNWVYRSRLMSRTFSQLYQTNISTNSYANFVISWVDFFLVKSFVGGMADPDEVPVYTEPGFD